MLDRLKLNLLVVAALMVLVVGICLAVAFIGPWWADGAAVAAAAAVAWRNGRWAMALCLADDLNRQQRREAGKIKAALENGWRWKSLAGDLWNELEAVDPEHRQLTAQMYVDQYEQMVGLR